MADIAPSADFSDEQKRYLEGFASGINVGRAAHQLSAVRLPGREPGEAQSGAGGGPTRSAIKAQDRVTASQRRRSSPTRRNSSARSIPSMPIRGASRRRPRPTSRPSRMTISAGASSGCSTCRAGAEVLYVPAAVAERHPHSIGQFAGLADLAERYGGAATSHGYDPRQPADPRDRAQADAVAMVEAIQDLGL